MFLSVVDVPPPKAVPVHKMVAQLAAAAREREVDSSTNMPKTPHRSGTGPTSSSGGAAPDTFVDIELKDTLDYFRDSATGGVNPDDVAQGTAPAHSSDVAPPKDFTGLVKDVSGVDFKPATWVPGQKLTFSDDEDDTNTK